MPGFRTITCALAVASMPLAACPAYAVVKGTRSQALAYNTVRLVGDGNCSGVVIARQAVATAEHCAYGMSVIADGRVYRVARVSKTGKLDDGTQVRATGDAAILVLSRPLPDTMEAVPIGEGGGPTFVIAGYGTTNERWRGAGPLHKAELVKAFDHDLVDPNRAGLIGASACYGDSGGPVIHGGWLVGIIARASHPSPRIACGYLTRWAPIAVAGQDVAKAGAVPIPNAKPPQRTKPRQVANKDREQHQQSWFAGWFATNKTRADLDKSVRR